MLEIFEMIADTTIILSVVLALAIILKFSQLSLPLKFVGVYLIVGASIEIVSSAYFSVEQSNLVFLHLFSFFEIVFLTHLFHVLFKILNSTIKIYYIAIPGIIFVILNSIFIQDIYQLNTYSSILTSTYIIGYCIHFFVLILDFKAPNSQFATLKWFIICLFIFHSISLGFMVFGSLLKDLSRQAQSIVWTFRGAVMLVTKVILIASFAQLFLNNSKLRSNE